MATMRSKARLYFELARLDELASNIEVTVAKLRAEFAKRHKPL